MDHHIALKPVALEAVMPDNLKVCIEFGPLNTKESDVLAQNVFAQKWIIIQFWNVYHYNCSMPENLRVYWVWTYKYKGKWCFSPKGVFSEMDH